MGSERFPVGIRLTGVLHKEKSKMYITSVLWSDQNEIVVYRSFEDFREMHKQLKKKFSSGSKMKKSDRILPKFQSNKVKQKSQGKGPNKSLVRLKYLQKYCNELLSCDQHVSQSADLAKFLQPNENELKPEFTKNSIIIMPSEDEIRSHGRQDSSGNVTQPFVTETYRCIAPYETKDTKNKPFKVAVNETLDVLIKDKGGEQSTTRAMLRTFPIQSGDPVNVCAGWWLVENEEKRMAWFPAPYLENVDGEEDEEEVLGTPSRGMLYTVVRSYTSKIEDEASVNIGEVVEVLQNPDNGWWLIRHKGKVGYVPSLNLQPYIYPRVQMTSQYNVQNSSSLLPASSILHNRRSYGDLPQDPNSRPIIPTESFHRSQSLNQLSEEPYAQPAVSLPAPANSHPTSPTSAVQSPLPVILVQSDEEQEESGRILRAESVDSFESDSFSDDDALSLSAGSSLNLSYGANDQQLRFCRTPQPTASNCLSPKSHPEGTLLPSVSDPNLYKGPQPPKVPPRPRAQEILTRCSTVTRKNATKSNLSPTSTEVTGR
ncbi:PREDICTED: NADPH oxidase organizer 1 isoform X1 [Poecilia mexicana]|uniref:NADPH oxidase organizer 1 isoform X1 n=1 Tax=Poecilia mexicana TaxID=48701 RepID=UPI00072E26FD|nr:PREDICTED: NADPH oxidase organizer 1 isoform X1 [Poecilia mexicana]XP_016529479.1 PREDICTED: NADPH oxidase organizer 1 isoform X1 [Poecilia formosa]